MRQVDPTDEPRGYTVYPTPNRRLRRFDHANQSAKRCVALSPCIATLADGTQVEFKKRRNNTVSVIEVGKSVNIRKRRLYADISRTIDTAERCGLNITNVTNEYRTRHDNGYQHDTTTITNETYSFRGSEV